MIGDKKTLSVHGPIAEKLIKAVKKNQNNKIIDFKAIKSAKIHQDQLLLERENEDFSHLNIIHGLYVQAQHRVSEFIELISCLSEGKKFNILFEEAEDIYLPSAPPMSPITKSFFYSWASFDMNVGLKRETLTTVMIDLYRTLKADPQLIQVIEHLQLSRMGLYIHEGHDKNFVYLRELYTNKLYKTHVVTQYNGFPGEIWYVRLLPDPFNNLDFYITFTTPYVIINALTHREIVNINELMYSEKDWLDYIERNLNKIKVQEPEKAYYLFMKYGLSKHYWLEYVFLAYINYQENMIRLTGFPDKAETLPHSPQFEEF